MPAPVRHFVHFIRSPIVFIRSSGGKRSYSLCGAIRHTVPQAIHFAKTQSESPEVGEADGVARTEDEL